MATEMGCHSKSPRTEASLHPPHTLAPNSCGLTHSDYPLQDAWPLARAFQVLDLAEHLLDCLWSCRPTFLGKCLKAAKVVCLGLTY